MEVKSSLLPLLSLLLIKGSNSDNAYTKTGYCPAVEEGTFGICVEACVDDYACDGFEKCCSNGCGHTCQEPQKCPHGEPLQDGNGVEMNCGLSPNAQECPADAGCHSHPLDAWAVCCGDNPFRVPKAGSCHDVAPGTAGVCRDQCYDDYNCPGDMKCCHNGCGRSCFEPEKTGEGNCPTLEPDAAGDCMEECSRDSDCASGQMCCSNGCGHSCINSYKPCNKGSPLKDDNGHNIFCGRGPNTQECPFDYYCEIDEADRYAVCCVTDSSPTIVNMSITGMLILSFFISYFCQ